MTSELANLSLFFYAVAKALLMTWIGPSVLIVYVAVRVARAFGVPAQPSDDLVVSLPTADRKWLAARETKARRSA